MLRKPYRRLILLAMLILTGVALNAGPAPQAARCATKAKCVSLPIKAYYTDATMTVQCGGVDICAGDQWGCVTSFVVSRRAPCCNPQ